jgi:hypothetical protein
MGLAKRIGGRRRGNGGNGGSGGDRPARRRPAYDPPCRDGTGTACDLASARRAHPGADQPAEGQPIASPSLDRAGADPKPAEPGHATADQRHHAPSAQAPGEAAQAPEDEAATHATRQTAA